jgi:hypothetical protein
MVLVHIIDRLYFGIGTEPEMPLKSSGVLRPRGALTGSGDASGRV